MVVHVVFRHCDNAGERNEGKGRKKKKVHVRIAFCLPPFLLYWYRYILMVIQISYATTKQEDSKQKEEESYSNIN